MKLLKFSNKKSYMFKTNMNYIPGGIDIDFYIIKADNQDDATSVMKSILRHKRKLTPSGYFKIVQTICLDDIKSDISLLTGVFYQY